jgi:hypothetical protein
MVHLKHKGPIKDVVNDLNDFANKSNTEPDVLIMVCTHSEGFTGDQVHSNSKANYAAGPINEVKSSYSIVNRLIDVNVLGFGGLFRQEIPEYYVKDGFSQDPLAELLWRDDEQSSSPLRHRTCEKVCTYIHLISNRDVDHFQSNVFELVVGFSGGSVLHSLTAGPLNKLVQKLLVDRSDLRFALTSSVVSDHDLLRHTPVVYVMRDGGKIATQCIGLHNTPSNAWGVAWKYCGTQNCARPKDILCINSKSGKVKQRCLRCGWQSNPLKAEDLGWLKKWSSAHPLVYTWSHPIEPINLVSFVHATKTSKIKMQHGGVEGGKSGSEDVMDLC